MTDNSEAISAKIALRDKLTQQVREVWSASVMSGVRELSSLFLENLAQFAVEKCMDHYEPPTVSVKHFGRWKYAEEYMHDLVQEKKKFRLRVVYDAVHIDPPDSEDPDDVYVYDDFFVDVIA